MRTSVRSASDLSGMRACATAFACLLAAASAAHAQAQERPNILFIFSDDHAAHALSAYREHLSYGARLPDTPNLDRLARDGMLFVNAFVTNSICGPSRATVLTGQYGHLNGVMTNDAPLHPTHTTFPRLLRDGGYETALIGKWHLRTAPTGFDYYEIMSGQGPYYNPVMHSNTRPDSVPYTGYTQDVITDRALGWLAARDSARAGRGDTAREARVSAGAAARPFALLLHYNATHRYWDPGPGQLELYRDTVFAEPATFFDDGARRASGFRLQEMDVALDLFPRDLKLEEPNNLNAEQLERWRASYDGENAAFVAAAPSGDALKSWNYQRYIQDYMRVVAGLDAAIGRVLDYLDESGLARNTMVVYTSDQGFFLGDHGWFDKRWMYEESLRTPLIVRWPGVVEPGSVNTDLVMNLDYAQTLLDAGGVAAPATMQGRSLLPLLRGSTPSDWRDAIYYQYFAYPDWHMVQRQYGVRTQRHKLIHYYEIGEWEMFDLARDPNELNSVYDDPAYAAVVATLKQRLEDLRREYAVPASDPVPHTPFDPPPGLRRPPELRHDH
ncbi:MAG TPA: sulfatase [Longimicrobiales bacterium]|nr:sulfatase [Longimicrobiales bacterium]